MTDLMRDAKTLSVRMVFLIDANDGAVSVANEHPRAVFAKICLLNFYA
jgi:hypothetical protein